jgi:hypothetical protein
VGSSGYPHHHNHLIKMKLAHLALNNNHSLTNSGKYLFVVNKYSHVENTYRAVRCVRAPKGSVVIFTAYQNFIELI